MHKHILLFFFICIFGSSHAQDTVVETDLQDTVGIINSPSEVSTNINNLSNRLLEIFDVVEPDEDIRNFDLVVREYTVLLKTDKKEIIDDLHTMSYQRLENLLRAWYSYGNKFNTSINNIADRINELESVQSELNAELDQWQKIREFLKEENYAIELQQNTDSIVVVLNQTLSTANTLTDSLYVIQKRQSQLIVFIDEMIRLLESEQKIYQSNYFILDSRPIWEGIDSTTNVEQLRPGVTRNFKETYNILSIYLRSNITIVMIQLLLIIALIIGFVLIGKMWPSEKLDIDSKREMQAGVILNHPFFSSLIIGIIISIFFYSNRPLILGNFFALLMMISSVVLLPALTTKKIKLPLSLLFVLYIVLLIQHFLPANSFLNRIISLSQCIAVSYIIYYVLKIKNELNLTKKGKIVVNIFLRVYGLLVLAAFISNIIGGVKLSNFLINSTIRTLSFSFVVVTIVIILNSMMILFAKGNNTKSFPMHEHLKNLIDKHIRPFVNWGAFVLWFIGVLIFFRLSRPASDWIDQVMDTEFMISTVSISIGGIISFFLIVFFTYLATSFIKSIFKDEWVLNSRLPRGTADAMSMLIRYLIVAFGVYLALSAIGLNMNELGFMAGALGVGIGFGLQNIVLNFIAGLILSFEHPIHVGDMLEVDNDLGRVTEIGVRASKIMTYNGSEVIIPNGLLISNKVINWTLTNEKRRLVISFRTAFDANPTEVIGILKNVAEKNVNVIKYPDPMALFNGYGTSSLDFTLYCWVEFNQSFITKSEIAVSAHEALAEAGIHIPIPVQKIQIDGNKDIHPIED